MAGAAPCQRIGAQQQAVADFVAALLGPLQPLLADPEVSEVLVNGPSRVFVERAGRLESVDARFGSEAEMMSCLRAVAQSLGKPLSSEHPILEGHLPDGSRLSALLPPLSPAGPCMAIRRHRLTTLRIEDWVASGSLTEQSLAYLQRAAETGQNVLVSGGTGTGKTSLLRCIASLIPGGQRVVTIEDARELHLQLDHVLALEARAADARGKGRVTIGELFVATLRLRPDRIVIGELRGREALDLIQAMTSGHGGCLSTVHASSPLDALRRVETLALMSGVELPLSALRSQVASAVDVIVQVARSPDGTRGVSSIAELQPLDAEGNYAVRPIFERVAGRLCALGPAVGATGPALPATGPAVAAREPAPAEEGRLRSEAQGELSPDADVTPVVDGRLAQDLDAAFRALEDEVHGAARGGEPHGSPR